MTRRMKDFMVDELRRTYGGVDSALVVNIIGLDAVNNNALRRQLREKNIELHVVKNSLVRIALAGTALEPLAKALDGPSALVTGGDSIIDVAKQMVAATNQFKKLELKVGLVEGEPDLIPIDDMAKMKGRRELHGDIAACAIGPACGIAGSLRSPAGLVVGCLKAIVEKAEGSAKAAA